MAQLIKLQDYISRYEVDMFRYPSQFIRQKRKQWDLKKLEKQPFLDGIFEFQLKWASSTVREKSYVDKEFYNDPNLKYFLQRFPDTYLVLYKPIFKLKKAPIEVEIIIISPTTTWLITMLEGEEDSVFLGSNERFWIERIGKQTKKVLSPMIELDRMDGIVRTLFSLYGVELPIRKVILNRTGYFDFPEVPYDVELVEKRNYDEWFSNLRNMSSPLKHMQLKAGNVLLQYCQTVCVRRMD
ncbi:NERD domain-containing protein [Bacillus nitroreducens]